ncbi:hypothetical protein H0I76_10510 [Limibaculum sp. M0105]|uniref:Uncharacterized protein n=1 Tax=Thermohalobaculum xanthum TaxID=2753746 RepID=A0A8J7M7G6_9RHOB|nr:hypothetical protein [Thermohalobaculum xanthum]MBK0399625.1 hypothetical protein [Thermohalobaculum xanthum]
MPSKDDALRLLDELLNACEDAELSGVSITALWIHRRLEAELDRKLESMPTCCSAMEERFQKGRDLFRRGKNRCEWYGEINAEHSSTFEVFFALPR